MKKIVYLILGGLLISSTAIYGQQKFQGIISYQNSLSKDVPGEIVFDSTVVSFTNEFVIHQEFYGGMEKYYFPSTTIISDTSIIQIYRGKDGVAFEQKNTDSSLEPQTVTATNEIATILGYSCRKYIVRTNLSTGYTTTAYYWVAEELNVGVRKGYLPKEIKGCQLKREFLVENKQGQYLFSKIMEAKRIDPSNKPIAISKYIGTRRLVPLNQENVKQAFDIGETIKTYPDKTQESANK